nr:YqhA family protein [Deinobacterium chartae]
MMALLGVASSLLLAAGLFVSAAVDTVKLLLEHFTHGPHRISSHMLAIEAVEQADTYLIATALLITGFGLYELFVAPLRVPAALSARTLDDLKRKLLGVTVVVLAVDFLADAAEWEGQTDLLHEALAYGVIILAIAVFELVHALQARKHS